MTNEQGTAGGTPPADPPEPPDADAAPAAPPALDLRVAEVTAAGDHPNADRLLVLQIDLGGEQRQLVAGLAGVYEPDALVGRRIVVVANLKPARLRGEVSEGMLLAAHGQDEVGLILAPEATPGTRVEAGPGTAGTEPITIDDFARHTLEAGPDGITIDGEAVRSPRLVTDRDAWGPVR